MFEAERVYSQRNPKTGQIEWFFMAREGNFGPFPDKNTATREMNSFIKNCIKQGSDGGRSKGKKAFKLGLVPMDEFAYKNNRK